MYKIEQGVELPPKNVGAKPRYPWAELEVGDSFFVPSKEGSASLRSFSAPQSLREKGWKFARRSINENGVKGVRFWRVA